MFSLPRKKTRIPFSNMPWWGARNDKNFLCSSRLGIRNKIEKTPWVNSAASGTETFFEFLRNKHHFHVYELLCYCDSCCWSKTSTQRPFLLNCKYGEFFNAWATRRWIWGKIFSERKIFGLYALNSDDDDRLHHSTYCSLFVRVSEIIFDAFIN